MMKLLGPSIVLALSLVACGEADTTDSEVRTLCATSIEVICAKIHECNSDKAALAAAGFGMDAAQCESIQEADEDCANTTVADQCPEGGTFDEAAANRCINDFQELTCDALEMSGEPESCGMICMEE